MTFPDQFGLPAGVEALEAEVKPVQPADLFKAISDSSIDKVFHGPTPYYFGCEWNVGEAHVQSRECPCHRSRDHSTGSQRGPGVRRAIVYASSNSEPVSFRRLTK